VFAPDAAAAEELFASGAVSFSPPEPFKQVGLLLEAGTTPALSYRALIGGVWSAWQPAELTWEEAPHFNARIILLEAASRLELRGGEGLSYGLISFYREAVANPQRLARNLPFATPFLDAQAAPGVVSRYEWGARDPGKVCGDSHDPYRATIHHTAGSSGGGDPAAVMRQMQAYHIDNNGWCDLGYHFVVSYGGTVFQGRSSEARTGAHVGGHNTGNVGISLMGNFETMPLEDAQLDGAASILGWVADTYGIPLSREFVKGHREYSGHTSNACPGLSVMNRFGELLTRAGGSACTRTWKAVQRGQSGSIVRAVQHLLRARGYSLSADGVFGSGTEGAVRSFQSSRDLTADGVVGPKTWEALAVTVRRGDSGEAVRAVQARLGLTVDGVFGSGTESAVRSFQSNNGLTADGVVGLNTWAALSGGKGCP